MYAVFPIENTFQQITTILVFFIFFPVLFNSFFLKRKVAFYGLSLGDWRRGLLWSLYSLIGIFVIFSIMSYYFGFLGNYKVPAFIVKNFGNFILYEFTLTLLFVAVYEFYFRGFVLFTFEVNLKHWTILAQALLFLILVLSIGRESLYLFLPYLIFAPFAGLIAYKSRSVLYSGVSQFLIIFILDALIVKMLG